MENKLQPEIDNINHPLMLLTRELLTTEGRQKQQKFIIDDPENILQAAEAGITIEQLFFYGDHAERHQGFLAQLPDNIECYPIRPRTCKKIFGVEKQARVFAIANIPQPKQLSDATADVAVLDGLMMMGNIGAIVRSALAFNISGIVILDFDSIDLFDRRLIRSSKGYIFKLPIICLPTKEFFSACEENDIVLVNCSHDANDTIEDVVKTDARLAFALGAEKTGVSEQVKQHASVHAKIPYNNAVESLNVSVAAAIVFYSRFLQTT